MRVMTSLACALYWYYCTHNRIVLGKRLWALVAQAPKMRVGELHEGSA